MAGSRLMEEFMQMTCPHTLNAMQHLVMAMADFQKNAGKKTFFGRDKGVKSYQNFLQKLRDMLHAMILDRLITEATPTEKVNAEILSKIDLFSRAFPNWHDAYTFAEYYFRTNQDEAIATLERLRGAA